MLKKVCIGILVSGSGSNLQAIIDQIEAGKLDAEIKIVISNTANAYAIKRCEKHKVPISVVDHRQYDLRESFDRKLISILQASDVELVVMAGFMRLLSPEFFKTFHNRIINIHPALLPAFPGMHVQQKALEYGVKFAGCTVHFADEGVDTGPIIIQAVVPVYPEDNTETLSSRILKEEHRIYPQAIQYYAEGRIIIQGRKVHIKNVKPSPEKAMHNPPLTIL